MARAGVVQTVAAHETKVLSVAWSGSGQYVATGARQGVVRVFYVLRGKGGAVRASPIRTLTGHVGDVLAMAFSRSDFLLTASMDRCVRLWHVDTALCLRRFVHPEIVTAVAFHPTDENFVMSGGCDGVVRVWKPADHACVAEEDVGAVVTAAEFGPQGDAAFVGTYEGVVHVLAVGKLVAGVGGLGSDVQAEREGSDDEMKPAPGLGVSKRVDVRRRRRGGKQGGVAGLAVDAGRGRMVVSGSEGRVTMLGGGVEAAVVERVRVAGKKGEAGGVRLGGSVSADGRYVVFDGVGGAVRVVQLAAEGERTRRREAVVEVETVKVMEGAAVSCAAFATEGAVRVAGAGECFLMAVGGDDGSVRIVAAGKE